MIFSGLEFIKKSPFKIAHIHATILTKEGKRMSKSLGTGIDPLDLIDRFGADAIRFGLIWQATGNQDIHWSQEHVVAGKKFCNKIWNATRFIIMSTENIGIAKTAVKLTAADKKILAGLHKIKKETGRLIETYDFSRALHLLYDFFWHKYADIYIETAKKQLTDEKIKSQTKIVLLTVHEDLIKLLHPFLPFLTEEIWGILKKSKNPIMIEEWPK